LHNIKCGGGLVPTVSRGAWVHFVHVRVKLAPDFIKPKSSIKSING
jgi:hypothetical protein